MGEGWIYQLTSNKQLCALQLNYTKETYSLSPSDSVLLRLHKSPIESDALGSQCSVPINYPSCLTRIYSLSSFPSPYLLQYGSRRRRSGALGRGGSTVGGEQASVRAVATASVVVRSSGVAWREVRRRGRWRGAVRRPGGLGRCGRVNNQTLWFLSYFLEQQYHWD